MDDTADQPTGGVTLHDWNDVAHKRKAIFDTVKSSMESQFPRSYGGVRMELHDVRYEGPEDYSIKDQKEALLENKFLHRKLRGKVKLFDESTGAPLDERELTLMRVPVLTDRHTFIHNGSEYSLLNQARLLPGVYTRRKASGELETHVNTQRGTGPSFRIRLEPESGLFKLDIGQSSLRLYSLLHDLGVDDEHLSKIWGPELLGTNKAAYDARVFEKAFMRLVRRPPPDLSREQKAQAIRDALAETKLDRRVLERTLPNRLMAKEASPYSAAAGSPTSATKITPKNVPPPVQDYSSPAVMNSDKPDPGTEFHKPQYLMLAQLLNEKFQAHISLDTAEDQLVAAIERAMKELMPGFNAEMLAQLLSNKESRADFGCLMAVLGPHDAAPILNWTAENIKPDDLTGEGIEHMPHITVRFGFRTGFDPARLKKALSEFKSVRFTLGKIIRFGKVAGGTADALVVEAESPDLVAMNKVVTEKFGSSLEDTVKKLYKPHLTLAYLKIGAGKKLDGHAWFVGNTFVLNTLTFKSAGSKRYMEIKL